jgi:hypothetical protein
MATWSEVSARVGRNDMLRVLVNNIGELDQAEIAKGLADSWTMCEWPAFQADNEVWQILFDKATDCQFILGDEGELISYDTLPEFITLYRGCADDHKEGMSWTSSYSKAKWFAGRFKTMWPSNVYEITIPSILVLGKFDRRNENEYVVDTTRLLEDDIQLANEQTIIDADLTGYFTHS